MQTLQLILCRGAVDRAFLGDLLDCPEAALSEYDLSSEEYDVIAGAGARSLADLARVVEAYRRGEPAGMPVREYALAS
jgi:hypothetical protein